MVNTYGIHSINQETFNTRYHESLTYDRESRNTIVLGFRIHNAVLNVLGYIPAVSTISGCVRIATGLIIIGFTLASHHVDIEGQGHIIGRWYNEAIATGITQIARGALEAFVSFGRVTNLILDIIATPFNISKTIASKACVGCMSQEHVHIKNRNCPHPDVDYNFPFQILKLA